MQKHTPAQGFVFGGGTDFESAGLKPNAGGCGMLAVFFGGMGAQLSGVTQWGLWTVAGIFLLLTMGTCLHRRKPKMMQKEKGKGLKKSPYNLYSWY